MSKDYAMKGRRTKRTRAKKKKSRTMPGWVWLILGLLVGLVIAIVCYFGLQGRFDDIEITPLASAVPTEKPTPPIVHPKKPTFDFYTVLPKGNHDLKRRGNAMVTTAKPTKVLVTKPKQHLLQVAAFETASAARQLQAKLLLQGFDVKVNSSKQGSTLWYKVSVGPFLSKLKALQAKQKLSTAHFDSMLVTE